MGTRQNDSRVPHKGELERCCEDQKVEEVVRGTLEQGLKGSGKLQENSGSTLPSCGL